MSSGEAGHRPDRRPAARDGLADKLVRTYGIERERALADADRFAAALADQGLLTT